MIEIFVQMYNCADKIKIIIEINHDSTSIFDFYI